MTAGHRWGLMIGIALMLTIGAYFYGRRGSGERFDARKHARLEQVQAKEQENAELRGQNTELRKTNDGLRRHVAEVESREEALQAIVKEAGGRIAAEQQKLTQIDERLKNDQAIINAPADRCLRCRRFSATALEQKLIDRPLACRDECAGQ